METTYKHLKSRQCGLFPVKVKQVSAGPKERGAGSGPWQTVAQDCGRGHTLLITTCLMLPPSPSWRAAGTPPPSGRTWSYRPHTP